MFEDEERIAANKLLNGKFDDVDLYFSVLLNLVEACDQESPWRTWSERKLSAWNIARALVVSRGAVMMKKILANDNGE